MSTISSKIQTEVNVQTDTQSGMIAAFFYAPYIGGHIGVKNRLYDFVEKLILIGFPIDHKFFSKYSLVDEITVREDGELFYSVTMTNNMNNLRLTLPIPCQVFNPKATTEDLFMYADVMVDYIEYFM